MNEKIKKINTLITDEEFNKSIKSIKTQEDIQKLFAARGIELTLDEFNEICGVADTYLKQGELFEDDLDMVSGGAIITAGSIFLMGVILYYGGNALHAAFR